MPRPTARIITAALALAASGLVALGASPAQASTAAGAFTPVDPYRLVNKVTIGAKSSLPITVAGKGGVPASGAGAVVLNVTATESLAAGYLTAYPTGGSPGGASNVNFSAGQTIANHVTVKVSTGGSVSIYNGSSSPVKVIADLSGWYQSGNPTAAGMFSPVAPSRLLDTRNGIGGPKAPLSPHSSRSFNAASGVRAGAFNITATRPTATGFITAHPDGTTQPNVSNLNFVRGQTIPNAATVQVGGNGKVALYNGSAGYTDLIADVAGWYSASGAANVRGSFHPVTPTRILDTRNGIGAPQAQVPGHDSVTLAVAGNAGVPAIGDSTGANAAVLNVTVTRPGGSGYITAYPTAAPRPQASNINFTAGQTIPNLVTVKLGSGGKINLYNGADQPVDLIADVAGWYNAGPAPAQFSAITNWSNWWLTLPVDANWKTSGTAAIIKQDPQPGPPPLPALANFQEPAWFHMDDTGDGVVFRANAGGARSSDNTQYPRSELRELNSNGSQAAWLSTTGTHTMTVTQAITHLPEQKPQVVAGQIHDASSDVIEIRLHGTKLYAWRIDGSNTNVSQLLDSNYVLGTKFKVEVRADLNGVTVTYWKPDTANAATNTATFPGLTGSGWYFKAGCYTQSNTTNGGSFTGDDFTAYGEVVIYNVTVQHAP
jgi:hypothetical protein